MTVKLRPGLYFRACGWRCQVESPLQERVRILCWADMAGTFNFVLHFVRCKTVMVTPNHIHPCAFLYLIVLSLPLNMLKPSQPWWMKNRLSIIDNHCDCYFVTENWLFPRPENCVVQKKSSFLGNKGSYFWNVSHPLPCFVWHILFSRSLKQEPLYNLGLYRVMNLMDSGYWISTG